MQFVILTSLMHVHAISIHYKSFAVSPTPPIPHPAARKQAHTACLYCIFYEFYSLQQLHIENN